jgi:hypothetical protein
MNENVFPELKHFLTGSFAVKIINIKGAVIIYGGGWHRRQNGWVNKILSKF